MTNDIETNSLYLIEEEEINLAKNNKRYLLEDKLLNSMSVEELKELLKDISDGGTLEKKEYLDQKSYLQSLDSFKNLTDLDKWFTLEFFHIMNGGINLLDKGKTIKKIKGKVWAKTKPKENTHNNYIDLKTIPIREVISKYVPLYNDPNRNIKCPFPDHDDKSPSFKIYHNTNSFYCFGCGKGGNTANFIAEVENITFKEAIKKLNILLK